MQGIDVSRAALELELCRYGFHHDDGLIATARDHIALNAHRTDPAIIVDWGGPLRPYITAQTVPAVQEAMTAVARDIDRYLSLDTKRQDEILLYLCSVSQRIRPK